MSEFTEGKWCFVYANGIKIMNYDMNKTIADVYHQDYDSKFDAEQFSNAKLIAAAPEMYKILDGLICKLKANGADEWEEIDEAIQEIERLIERIDGEEHEELHEVEAQA